MKSRALVLLLALLAPTACTGNPTQPPLRSLRGASDTALLCLAEVGDPAAGETTKFVPRSIDSCPDYNSDDNEVRTLYSVVAQRETGEVALVDLQNSTVIDAETAVPGTSFVPVGAEPVSIVSTPGGVASFVAVREPGKEGIYGLPTSCIGTRSAAQQAIDITSWPACRLPAAPGAMELLVDRGVDEDSDPLTPATQRISCDAAPDASAALVGVSPGATRSDCPADLATEIKEPGRRKLVVALPSLGQLVLIDAQALLDRAQGSFDECPIERTLQLAVDLPTGAVSQSLPSDLPETAVTCPFPTYNHGPSSTNYLPDPVDFAKTDKKLYVADLVAPVIHVLDTVDPCNISEAPPLLPMSFTEPSAVVTTRRVAVSPLTSKRDRFLYAIDESPTRTAGSVMIFDVSDDSTERTPIVRPGSALIPQEPPDRIQFVQEAVDVEFVDHRVPVLDPITGVAVDGIQCNPGGSANSVAAQYRPNSDLTSGAGPATLRGVFAFVGLHSGQVAVVDVEDLDAPCRRPTTVNTRATEDFRGCAEDRNANYENPQTVSAEISCNVVEPHRARSAAYFINEASNAGRGAALRQFPRLTSGTGRLLPTDQSDDGKNSPILLGVDFASSQPAQLFVGASRYDHVLNAENELVLDPARAERSSLTLSFEEPRLYLPNEQFSLTYEGRLSDVLLARFEHEAGKDFAVINEGVNGKFCSHGIQDVAATRQFADQFLPDASKSDLDEFAAGHSDYIQLNSDFPEEDSDYWQSAEGSQCGASVPREDQSVQALTGHRFCELWFGSPEVPTTRRDFRIRDAFENRVVVEPRRGRESPELLLGLVSCCFPEPMTYRVRAGQQWVVQGSSSGFQHDMIVDDTSGRCVHDCNPLKQRRNARALEISCNGGESCFDETGRPIIGLAIDTSENGKDLACVINDPRGGVTTAGSGGECIFRGLNTSFAIYRGRTPSTRDMRFSWQLRGGFSPLTVNLSLAGDSVPERLRFVPNLGSVLVADAGTAGLSLISLVDLLRTTIN